MHRRTRRFHTYRGGPPEANAARTVFREIPNILAIILIGNPCARCKRRFQPSPPQPTTPFSSRLTARVRRRGSRTSTRTKPPTSYCPSSQAPQPAADHAGLRTLRPALRFESAMFRRRSRRSSDENGETRRITATTRVRISSRIRLRDLPRSRDDNLVSLTRVPAHPPATLGAPSTPPPLPQQPHRMDLTPRRT